MPWAVRPRWPTPPRLRDGLRSLSEVEPAASARGRGGDVRPRAVGGLQRLSRTFTETAGKGHGRIETCHCWTIDDPDYRQYVDPDQVWPGLYRLVMVEAKQHREDRTTTKTRCFISRLSARDARLPQTVRRHWRYTLGTRTHCSGFWCLPGGRESHPHRPGRQPQALLRCLVLNLVC